MNPRGLFSPVSDTASRWSGLLGIVIGNLLPLWLVWRGDLEVGDLVLVYMLELIVSFILATAAIGRWGRVGGESIIKNFFNWVALAVLLLPVLLYFGLQHVTWDLPTMLVVLATLISNLIGFVATLRRKGSDWQRGLFGAFGWRFFLGIIAVMAASAGSSYDRLLAAGWEPFPFGSGWAIPAGESLTELAVNLDLSPVVVAAGMLCTYRLIAEVLYEIFDVFKAELP